MQSEKRVENSTVPTPLIVLDAAGTVEAVLACNEKSRNKSLEQSELWIVRPENGRVLPYRGGGVRCGVFTRHENFRDPDAASDEPSWYQVQVADTDGRTESGYKREFDGMKTGATRIADTVTAESMNLPVLSTLADLIAARRREMPEGSYTTHLFSKGPSKIRKKVGEEAVELILASTRADIVAEAADLLYHTMVLLEVEGIRIEEIVGALEQRHAG